MCVIVVRVYIIIALESGIVQIYLNNRIVLYENFKYIYYFFTIEYIRLTLEIAETSCFQI